MRMRCLSKTSSDALRWATSESKLLLRRSYNEQPSLNWWRGTATVTIADVCQSNGVIHDIHTVLLPK
ncbi:fasciclin domain-containing protein [Pelagibius marinus]|uniref:fasciclin domain-containing protein n=1 Tax=Pelagibius marinus TaxID=2762760 RepID=UPI00345F327B